LGSSAGDHCKQEERSNSETCFLTAHKELLGVPALSRTETMPSTLP
jgi:hypothetical protein